MFFTKQFETSYDEKFNAGKQCSSARMTSIALTSTFLKEFCNKNLKKKLDLDLTKFRKEATKKNPDI